MAAIPVVLPTDRRCASCGAKEQRIRDVRGSVSTNLNPLTGTCLDCVIEASRLAREMGRATEARFTFDEPDPKQRAANDVE